jgi:hypothetical protein
MSKTGTLDKRNEIISVRVPYEIKMMKYAYEELQLPASNSPADWVFIECFCIHVRNLIDFFWEDQPLNSKDAVARHFTYRCYSPFAGICPQESTQGIYGKINKQIAHITYDSTEIEAEKIGPDDRKNLYDIIVKEIHNFWQHIRPPYRAFEHLYSENSVSSGHTALLQTGLLRGEHTGPVGSKSSGYRPTPGSTGTFVE